MTSREAVRRALTFQTPAWLPHDFPGQWGSDFAWLAAATPSPDHRPTKGVDEWGAVWDNVGDCLVGEVKVYPLEDWANFDTLSVPDLNSPGRWQLLDGVRERAGDQFLLGFGFSLYERIHFLRGLENTWTDIYEYPDELARLIDRLVEMNLVAVEKYAAAGVDGYFFTDDWGLQERLMIDPVKWREFWKPAYARLFQAVHDAGMHTFMHSCGHIVAILDDLIEIGLEAVHMDQQANMGLELLGQRFGGRINFFSPVDIQVGMQGALDDVRAYARQMAQHLLRREGGLIPRWYTDPQGAGHTPEALDVMCEEFLAINREVYG